MLRRGLVLLAGVALVWIGYRLALKFKPKAPLVIQSQGKTIRID